MSIFINYHLVKKVAHNIDRRFFYKLGIDFMFHKNFHKSINFSCVFLVVTLTSCLKLSDAPVSKIDKFSDITTENESSSLSKVFNTLNYVTLKIDHSKIGKTNKEIEELYVYGNTKRNYSHFKINQLTLGTKTKILLSPRDRNIIVEIVHKDKSINKLIVQATNGELYL